MKSYDFIKQKQQLWAKLNDIKLVGSKIERGEKNYTKDFSKNFFRAISEEAKKELSSGDGNELGDGVNPGKIQALHSSSALTVNVFDYWKNLDNKADIAKALLIPSTNIKDIVFERKFPILDNSNISPNIDVVVEYKNNSCCAIECKFTEPFSSRQENHGLKDKYLTGFGSWELIPGIHKLAVSISPEDGEFKYLHAAQLIKHILGLMSEYKNDKSKFRLVYLYYAAFSEEGCLHEQEIEKFTSIVKKDGITFQSISCQELILKIAKISWGEQREYVSYLINRYL